MTQDNSLQNFKVNVSDYKNYKIISFENKIEIDLYNITEVAKIFKEGNSNGSVDWVIDLKSIQFIDSSGLSGLVNQSIYLAKRNKTLILLSPSSRLLSIFNALDGTRKVFTILSDISLL